MLGRLSSLVIVRLLFVPRSLGCSQVMQDGSAFTLFSFSIFPSFKMMWFKCSVLLTVAVTAASLVGVSAVPAEEEERAAAARRRQQTSLFVQYNVTKALGYLWDMLEQHNTTQYSYYHTCCW